MPRPRRVSAVVLEKISEAIDAMASDPSAPRTKRHLEQHAGLSHDVVARAFRQDASEPDNPYRISEKFAAAVGPSRGGRRSASQQAEHEELDELKDRVTDLDRQLDRFATTALAYYLDAQRPDLQQTVVPLRSRRRPRSDGGRAH